MTIINGVDTELTKPDLLVMQCLLRDAERNTQKSGMIDSGYTSQASGESSDEDSAAACPRDRSRGSHC